MSSPGTVRTIEFVLSLKNRCTVSSVRRTSTFKTVDGWFNWPFAYVVVRRPSKSYDIDIQPVMLSACRACSPGAQAVLNMQSHLAESIPGA